MSHPIVVLDPGHGGRGRVGGSSANNATGPNGLLEKDLTLDLARRVPALLAGVADVSLTRDRDVNLALTDRARIARDRRAALFLSVHLNGFTDPGVDGSEVWVSRQASDTSRSFAKRMLSHLSAATGVRNRGVRESDFGVLLPDRHDPHTGACLAEISFLTNPEQARKLSEEKYRQRIAEAMAAAIREQLPVAKVQGNGLDDGFETHYGEAFDAPDKADWISLEFENIRKIKGSAEEQAFFLTTGGSNDQRAHFSVKVTNNHNDPWRSFQIFAPVLFVRLAKNIGGDSWQTIPLEKQEAGKQFLRMQENWTLFKGQSRTINVAIKKETLEAAYKAYPQNPFAFLRFELEARPYPAAGRKQMVRQAKQVRFALVKPVEMLSDSMQFLKRVALSEPQYRDKYATLIWSKRFETATTKPSEIKFSIVSTASETNENETTETHQITRTDTETKKLEFSGKIGFALGDLAKIGKSLTGELGVTYSKEWSTSLADQYSTALRTLRQSMASTVVSRELTFEIPPTAAGKTVNLYLVPVFKLYKANVVHFEGPDLNGQATNRIVESLPLMLFEGWQELQPEVIDTPTTKQPTKAPPPAKLPAPASGQSLDAPQALDVNMEPLTITVSEKRRAQLLQRAGWKQVNISVTVKNFLGQPLMEHKLLAEFKSPGVAAVAEGGDVAGGAVDWSKVWLKPEGTVRLMAVSTDKWGLVPTGVIHYRIPDKGSLKLEAVQEATEVSVTAESSQEAAEKSGVKGSGGIDFKVAQVGGEVSSESDRTKGTSRSVTWKVTLPTSTLSIKQL